MSMRIVAGKHKGRRLQADEGEAIRPTSSRARESVFNILMHPKFLDGQVQLADSVVADLCCGTGAFALEALSRGAARAVLVDNTLNALKIAHSNVIHVGEIANCKLMQADVSSLPQAPYECDILYLDPPYHQDLCEKALQGLLHKGWLKPMALIMVEQQARETLVVPVGLRLLDVRTYGNAKVSILTNVLED